MSGILFAPTPVPGPASRTDTFAPVAQTPRITLATRTETARAPRPPDGAGPGLNLRFEDREGRPLGPPPAFQTTLLQALREGALEPPPPRSAESVGASGFAQPVPEAAPELVDRKV